ncbi:SHOCT domain-containing protein [Hansschlegelia zhihuaiae]|uniref:SHOCT domain-containing protein n=1 Tax=Hansschlegelia zhihuaiae TaxID=405005 RepID=A0A4Q0M316_9HYPH|nr:SHOCT domain-containing protein [Hansschlegelia zhihuaiae]RXF67205.1 SHOCT domain-containing protein [Hansschlegelia zhihuaiae]
MTEPVSDALAELVAMRASGEISSDEFVAARDRLREGRYSSPGGRCEAALRAEGTPDQVAALGVANRAGETAGDTVARGGASKKSGKGRRALLGIGTVLLVLILLGSGGGQTVYKRDDYGSAWPYPSYDKATVRCEVKKFGSTDRPVATVELGGITYGLNGAARGIGAYPDPTPLEAFDQAAIAGTRQKMIDDALAKLCRWTQ